MLQAIVIKFHVHKGNTVIVTSETAVLSTQNEAINDAWFVQKGLHY